MFRSIFLSTSTVLYLLITETHVPPLLHCFLKAEVMELRWVYVSWQSIQLWVWSTAPYKTSRGMPVIQHPRGGYWETTNSRSFVEWQATRNQTWLWPASQSRKEEHCSPAWRRQKEESRAAKPRCAKSCVLSAHPGPVNRRGNRLFD